jgi:tetratricopeptide (TPR) repeat protein
MSIDPQSRRQQHGETAGALLTDPAAATGGYTHAQVDKARLPKPTRVKNKAPAKTQITAEQILREARDMQEAEGGPKVPKQNITDPEELAEYRMSKRKEFEDVIRRNRTAIGVWVKYAKWEESQRDFQRARSVYERALDIEYQNHSLWLKYAEMEMRHKQVNHARNIWDRATALLPRIDQFWYKYAFMEEMLGNISGARLVFERWLEWQPDDQAYLAYVKMEQRYDELDRCRHVFNRYVESHGSVRAWIRYARFEEKSLEIARSRAIFERAMEELGDDGAHSGPPPPPWSIRCRTRAHMPRTPCHLPPPLLAAVECVDVAHPLQSANLASCLTARPQRTTRFSSWPFRSLRSAPRSGSVRA